MIEHLSRFYSGSIQFFNFIDYDKKIEAQDQIDELLKKLTEIILYLHKECEREILKRMKKQIGLMSII